jgi:hypothetical protein
VKTGSRGRDGDLSCEWIVVAKVGDREVVVRIAKYSETEKNRANRQVLKDGGILSYRPLGSQYCQSSSHP